MIFIVCLLLQIYLIFADSDNEQLVNNIDNSITLTTAEGEPNEQATENNATTEYETSELTNSFSLKENTDEETVAPADKQDENVQPTIEKDALTKEQNEAEMPEDTQQENGEDNSEEEDAATNTVSYVSPTFDTTKINGQKNGLFMQTTALATIPDNTYPKKITVVNTITPEKTAYTHWTGTYTPEFTVTVDGQHVGMSCKEHIELSSTTMAVAYHAQFPAQRSSEDSVVVTLEQNTQTIAVDFDWHSEPRLRITQSS